MKILRRLAALLILSLSCTSLMAQDGQSTERIIDFAGMKWVVKDSAGKMGPGPNHFSDSEKNVWVDSQGRLHLKISKRDGKWYCAEVYTKEAVSYGTYKAIVDGPVHAIDPNAIFGFFTWDNHTTVSDANTEIDIEVTRWSDPNAVNLHFSVQPTAGPEGFSGPRHRERYYGEDFVVEGKSTLHIFTWEPEKVHWECYQGTEIKRKNLITSFAYNDHSPSSKPRRSAESQPLLTPKPSPTTELRFNLWLNQGWAPTDGKPIEVIVADFRYYPAAPKTVAKQ